MKIILACTIWLISFPPVCAQHEVVSPPNLTQEQKARILKKAYELNGNEMKGSIDMSDDPEVKCYLHQSESGGQAYFDCPQPEKVVKTEKITPKENFENRFLVPPPPDKKRHGPK